MASRSNTTTRRPTVHRQTSGQLAAPATSPTTRRQLSAGEDDSLFIDTTHSSVGKTGAVERGVTRPKRRLSRAMSNNRPTPPTTPNGSATYQALQNQLAAASTNPYQSRPPQIQENRAMTTNGKDDVPRLWGMELKWISLVTLALQNAFLTIIMHYSRISTAPGKTYSAAAAVLLNELLKGAISIVFALKHIDQEVFGASRAAQDPQTLIRAPPSRLPSYLLASRFRSLASQVFSPDCYKLAVPAILYVIQNNLQYVAASNLDVATFQVTYQMKILTTAFFSVLLLRKRLSKTKWMALVLLAVGVGIVQIQSTSAPAHSSAPPPTPPPTPQEPADLPRDYAEEFVHDMPVMHPLRGFIAVTLACMTSGLAGVYFEFILKSSGGTSTQPDLWVRNTQLSLFSLVPALIPIFFGSNSNPELGWLRGVLHKFDNFNGWALGTVLTQTFGGLITAIVIRYSDNIMKGFATSLSIVISFLASVALFSYPITLAFIVGSTTVLIATYIYNSPGSAAPTTRSAVGVPPGSPIPTSAPILGEPEKPSRASSVISLFGLGSGSNAPSRLPSSNDLRGYSNLSLTASSSPSQQHIYAASAPGSPYVSTSNLAAAANGVHDSDRASPKPLAPASGGLKRDVPQLTVDTGRK